MINRIQTVEEVEAATMEARAAGYTSVNYDLIYGLPLQTVKGLTETIKSVLKLKPERIAFYSYAHVPWVKPGQRKYTEEHLPDVKMKQVLYETGRALLKNGGYEEIGMDHFALAGDTLFAAGKSGNLHRNFMGYTDQYSKLMIGLGVSSISDTWTGFAQNVKKVEEYLELIREGEIPVVKGHILNEEDLVLRQHILNIMCKGHTSWFAQEQQSEAFFEGLERMVPLVEDGLVEIRDHHLEVTVLGKRFLRNICMMLDARLWRHRPDAPIFSMAG